MPDELSGEAHIYARTDRAKEHLDSLQWQIEIFLNSNPRTVTVYTDTEQSRKVIRVEMNDPISRTAILAGDFAHSLRSALDHVLWAMYVAKHKRVPKHRPQFPILKSENADTFASQTDGLDLDATKIIESLQPYKRPDGSYLDDPLWQLHMLDIVDKHRRIAVRGHGFGLHIFSHFRSTKDKAECEAKGVYWEEREIDNGSEMVMPPSVIDVEVKLEPVQVFFGDYFERISLTFDRLSYMYDFVRDDVIPRFKRFFHSPWIPSDMQSVSLCGVT
jgi:hypothetical protein